MTKETLAAAMHGRQYLKEMTPTEQKIAKDNGLVAIFGASLCKLRGAINEELGAYEGTEIKIGSDGELLELPNDDERKVLTKFKALPYVLERLKAAIAIQAKWCAEPGYSWTITTDFPHASFDIMEDAEKYCRGIVIDLRDIRLAFMRFGQ